MTPTSYSEKMGDFTWGNRFDLGFIDDDSKGWIGTIWHIDGPNEEDIVAHGTHQPVHGRWSPDDAAVHPIGTTTCG